MRTITKLIVCLGVFACAMMAQVGPPQNLCANANQVGNTVVTVNADGRTTSTWVCTASSNQPPTYSWVVVEPPVPPPVGEFVNGAPIPLQQACLGSNAFGQLVGTICGGAPPFSALTPGTTTSSGTYGFGAGAIVNSSAASATFPDATGLYAALPATCTVGQQYFATDSTAGQNIFGCTAPNVWTLEGGGFGVIPGLSVIANSTSAAGNATPLTATANQTFYANSGGTGLVAGLLPNGSLANMPAATIKSNLTVAAGSPTDNTTGAVQAALPTAWASTKTYIASATATFGGLYYINLSGVNTATNPSLDSVNWQPLSAALPTYNGPSVLGNASNSLATAAAILGTANTVPLVNGAGTAISFAAVPNAALATMPTGTFKGNVTGALAVPSDVTASNVQSNLPVAWVASQQYANSALATFANLLYQNITGVNTATNPSADTTNWSLVGATVASMTGSTSGAAGTQGITPANPAGTQFSPLLGNATWAANTQIADTGTTSVIQNTNATGNVSLYPTTTTGTVTYGAALTTATTTINTGSGGLNIGTNGLGQVTIGSDATSTPVVNIQGGGGIFIATATTTPQNVLIGSDFTTTNVNIQGNGGIEIGTTPNNPQVVAIGNATAGSTINLAGPVNLTGTTTPLQVQGSAGTAGQYLVSAGAGATPKYAGTVTSTFASGATTGTVAHNIGSIAHTFACYDTVANVPILPSGWTPGVNSDTFTFSGGLVNSSVCSAR